MAAKTEVQLHTVISAVPPPYLAETFQELTIVSFAASSTVLKTMHGFNDGQYGAIFLLQVTAVLGVLTGRGLAKRFGLKMLLSAVLLVNACIRSVDAPARSLSAVAPPPKAAGNRRYRTAARAMINDA